MEYEEIFNKIKDNFAGVKMLDPYRIALLTKDGESFEVEQSLWDKQYEIRFHCHGDTSNCDSCSEHGSEKWEVLKR